MSLYKVLVITTITALAITIVSPKVSFAQVCNETDAGKCGTDAGCNDPTEICRRVPSTIDVFACQPQDSINTCAGTPTPTPSVSCGLSVEGVCNAAGGCPTGNKCTRIENPPAYWWECEPDLSCGVAGGPGPTPPLDVPLVTVEDLLRIFFAISLPAGVIFGAWQIIQAGYTLKTSEGNPQKIKDGQEQLTAAVMGTIFILLSLVILRVIIRSVLGANVPGL